LSLAFEDFAHQFFSTPPLFNMLFRGSAAFLLWISIAAASPLSKRVTPPNGADVYIPDGNGNLVQGALANSPDGTPGPFSLIYQGVANCEIGFPNTLNFAEFCNQRTTVVYGKGIKISPDVDCRGLATCSQTQTTSFTATSSFAIQAGLDIPLVTPAIKAAAKLQATKTWTDSSTQSQSLVFVSKPSAYGHMVFFPYMQKACGYSVQVEVNSIVGYDVYSCGYTPLTLSNGQPDGASRLLYSTDARLAANI
jgi:hypothetical protein